MTKKEEKEDLLLSQSMSKLQNITAQKREALRDPEVKQQLMDWIFGKRDENPLAHIK